jgi:cytochrome bd-type quinol oxidase subunit 2
MLLPFAILCGLLSILLLTTALALLFIAAETERKK